MIFENENEENYYNNSLIIEDHKENQKSTIAEYMEKQRNKHKKLLEMSNVALTTFIYKSLITPKLFNNIPKQNVEVIIDRIF